MELLRVYEAERNQWGFQSGRITECTIVFTVNIMRGTLSHAAVLNIRKAYHKVPRNTLQYIFHMCIQGMLSVMVRILQAPITVSTKKQISEHFVRTLSGTQAPYSLTLLWTTTST